MKLSLMHEFIRLAANKNYSKTASELFMAQPVLSRHIASIEKELGVKLVERTTMSFALTDAGKIVLEDFKRILGDYQGLLDKLTTLDENFEGTLELGVLYYDFSFYVSKIAKAFREKYPHVKLVLRSYQPQHLERDLLEGNIDVAMLYGAGGCTRNDVDSLPFLQIPFYLIYDKSHRLASVKEVSLDDFKGENILRPEKPFTLSNQAGDNIDQLFQSAGVTFADTIPISNYDEVAWLLEENDAVYLAPMANKNAYGPSTEARLFLPETLHSDIGAVWLKANDNPAIKLLCNTIKGCYP